MNTIFHLVRACDWPTEGANTYRPTSLATEGFIHCSTPEQVAGAAARYFVGVDDLLVLELDVQALSAPLIWENTTGGSEPFPHLYGPINLEAVIEVRPFSS